MSFKLGLVGLCTSHPANWVPIIRQLTAEHYVDAEVRAAWDSGQTRPAGYAKEFCRKKGFPLPPGGVEDRVDEGGGVIFHPADGARHGAQAGGFVQAGKSV